MSKAARAATIAVALVSAFACGALAYRHWGGGRQPVSSPPASDEIELKPSTLAGGAPVPKTAPDFSLPDLDGKLHSIREWQGRPLLINFWATWCVPCREEIPLLSRLRREQQVKGLEIVGIAIDVREDVVKYVANVPIDYPILIGEDGGTEAASAFGVHELALPFTVVLDRRGEVLALRLGQIHELEARVILDALADLESGKIDLASAQQRVAAGLRR